MKKVTYLMFVVLMVTVFSRQTASAQSSIIIPKASKNLDLGELKQSQQPRNSEADQPNNENPENRASSGQNSSSEEMDFRLTFFLDEIAKAQKAVDEYTPEEKIYLVGKGEYDWLVRAVSPKKRTEFYEKWKTLLTPNGRTKFDSALDSIAASAAKKFPLYKANPKVYNFHNPVEEKMMRGKIENVAQLKIYKVGLNQTSWLIDKNNLGIPTARYKQGMIWLRDPADDHSYCHISYINIIQDYAGGGTYGASYARFTGDELAGCP